MLRFTAIDLRILSQQHCFCAVKLKYCACVPLRVSMAKRYNMRLVLKQRFSEFFEEKVKKDHHRRLMMKMMALEVEL